MQRSPGAKQNEWSSGIYQVYPRSFYELRPDAEEPRGEGSLTGVIHKLPYLYNLGVKGVWISPFFLSPMKDGGYDISDYTEVDERYGCLADFQELVEQAHSLDMKVMIDFIPNHTSNQHQWFQESRQSRHNSKSDWYVWKDSAPDGSPPNNWASVFSIPQLIAKQQGELIVPEGELTPPISAWTFDKLRQQYYLHSFAPHQPDLNWHNPEVREAAKNNMRFWLDRGIDGFRIDAVNYIGKNPDFPDELNDPTYREGVDNPYDQLVRYNSTGYPPTFYSNIKELLSVLKEYPDRDLRILFEAYMDDTDLRKIDATSPKNASSFNFTRLDAPWDARLHKKLLDQYHNELPEGAIPNQVNGNHDKSRLASRIGMKAARTAAVANLTLPGMIFIYNGEEGGFTNVEIPPDRQDDTLGGRDPVRTPMLWTDEVNAGFSKAKTEDLWLPVDPEYEQKNLEAQARQQYSCLSLYRSLLRLRNGSPTLSEGKYHPLFTSNGNVLAFARRHQDRQVTTILNFSSEQVTARLQGAEHNIGRVILTSFENSRPYIVAIEDGVNLYPNEGVVVVASA